MVGLRGSVAGLSNRRRAGRSSTGRVAPTEQTGTWDARAMVAGRLESDLHHIPRRGYPAEPPGMAQEQQRSQAQRASSRLATVRMATVGQVHARKRSAYEPGSWHSLDVLAGRRWCTELASGGSPGASGNWVGRLTNDGWRGCPLEPKLAFG